MLFLNQPPDAEGSAHPAIIMGIFVVFGGILFGYDTGIIGGILAMGERYNEVLHGLI
jgi:SP family sugar:H+ symporter-like MFS transporter